MAARISGEIELAYTDYSMKEDGEKKKSLSSFAQNYSIYYDKTGFLGDQRIGNYDIGLGYQWTANATNLYIEDELDDKDYEGQAGKVLFRGHVNIAPGGLPFHFRAWSYDNNKPTYTNLRIGEILDSNVIIGSRSREDVYSGLTLMAGIQNGSYLGAYRKILSAMPRLFIDYSQHYVRDMDGLYNEHTLSRDLAFVSLNKKDNWFHYRAYDHQDYQDSSRDFSSKTILLGTVDQTLTRQWINMTNWIKIAVDGRYTEEDSEERLESAADPKTFALNLFAKADYGKTRVSNFNSFRRTTDEDKRQIDFDVPIYANGWIDSNRSWNMQLQMYRYTEDLFKQEFSNLPFQDEEGAYLAGRLGVGHNKTLKFDSTLELERTKINSIQIFAARARQEIARRNSKNPWLLGYTATFITPDDIADEGSGWVGNVFENELYGSHKWAMSPRNVLELRQNIRYSSAVATSDLTSRFIAAKGYAGTINGVVPGASPEPLYSSETSLELESVLRANLKNRVMLSANYYSGGSGDQSDVSLVDKLTYRSNRWRVSMTNGLYMGDDLPDITVGRNIAVVTGSAQPPNYLLGHTSTLEYSPFRNFKSRANLNFILKDTDDGSIYVASLLESSEYTFFSRAGRKRALARVYQEFQYEKYYSDFTTASFLRFNLGASYYPFSTLELGGEISYTKRAPLDSSSLALTTMAMLHFSKLSCEARYSYGIGKVSDQSYDEHKEHLFEAKVRKTF